MKKFVIAMSFLVTSSAHAMFCQWTIQGTNSNFERDSFYKKPPKLVNKACDETGAEKTLCSGYLYCDYGDEGPPPEIRPVACPAVQFEGKWRCPAGQTCATDEEVLMTQLGHKPKKLSAAAPAEGATTIKEESD